MTNNLTPRPPVLLPAAILQPGYWVLTYAPNGVRPRWHCTVAVQRPGSDVEVGLLNRTTTVPPFLRHYAPHHLLIVATGDPGPDPDLIRTARQALTPAWPATSFDAMHMRGGVRIFWTDGPTRSAVQTLLGPRLGDYRAVLCRRNSMLALAVWLIRTYPEPEPERLRHLSSLAEPTAELDILPDVAPRVIQMAETLCACAASTTGGTFHNLKMTYAKLGYDTLAAVVG